MRGKAELRRHFAQGLEFAPNLTFAEEAFLTCPGGYALLCRRDKGNRALDVVPLDRQHLAISVRAYYEHQQQ